MTTSAVIIVSGGMDSTTLLHKIFTKKVLTGSSPSHIHAVSFDYGQTLSKELECAAFQTKQLGCRHTILDIKPLAKQMFSTSALTGGAEIPTVQQAMGDPQPASYVPNRNLLFIEMATAIAENEGCYEVYYGAQQHDVYGYWDTTTQFLNQVNLLHNLNRKARVQVLAPFINYSKAQILEDNKMGGYGIDYAHTWSCYKGGEIACGVCPTCAERLHAFKTMGLQDPLPYAMDYDYLKDGAD